METFNKNLIENNENSEKPKNSLELINEGKKIIKDILNFKSKLQEMPRAVYEAALQEKMNKKDRVIFMSASPESYEKNGELNEKVLIGGAEKIYIRGGEYGELARWVDGETMVKKYKEKWQGDEDLSKLELVPLPDDYKEACNFIKKIEYQAGELVRIYYDNPIGRYPTEEVALSLEDAMEKDIIIEESNTFDDPEGWKRVTTPVGSFVIKDKIPTKDKYINWVWPVLLAEEKEK